MSAYINFEYDFIKRTLDVLENYDGIYDVTSLINNCIGLLVLPKELLSEKIPVRVLSNSERTFGITRRNIKHIKTEKISIHFENYDEYNTRNVVTHMRNAISHGRVKQENIANGQIESLHFEDWWNGNKTFEALMSVKELKDFVVSIANEVLKSE